MLKDEINTKWNKFNKLEFPTINIDSDLIHSELMEIDIFPAGCIPRYLAGNLNQECI